MWWLSDRFIQDAQDSPLAGDIPKHKIPAILELVASGKDAVLRLLTSKDEVVEMTECEFLMYMRKTRTYVQDTAHQYRDSIISILTTSTADSGRHSALSDQSRASIASTATGASIFSLSAPSKRSKKSVAVPTTFNRTTDKPLICPPCGQEFGRSQDLFKHIRTYHESQDPEFQCMYCEQSSEDRIQIELHCQRAHPAHVPSVHVLPSFEKAFRRCSFCEQPVAGLSKYLKCMEADQIKYPTLIPVPTKRLRALLRQSKATLRAVEQACESRQLHRDAWEEFAWDDESCERYSRKLEYGINGPNDAHRPGIDDIHQFVEEILQKATFESTGEPVPPIPPPKTATGPAGDAASTSNNPALTMPPFHLATGPQYRSNFAESPASSIQTPCPGNLYISTPRNMTDDEAAAYRECTASGIERAAQQNNSAAPQMYDEMENAAVAAQQARQARQKRHPSNDSTADNRSRAKRQPMMRDAVPSDMNSGYPNPMAPLAQNAASPYPSATGERGDRTSGKRNSELSSFGTYDQQPPVALGQAEVGYTHGPNPLSNEYSYDKPSNYENSNPNPYGLYQVSGYHYGGQWYIDNGQKAPGLQQSDKGYHNTGYQQPYDVQETDNDPQDFGHTHFF